MRGSEPSNRLGRLVGRTKPLAEQEAQSRAAVSPEQFGRSAVSRPRVTNHELTEQERLWIDVLKRDG